MSASSRPPPPWGIALFVFSALVVTLFAGFLPLTMPLGMAAGGVLETGQVAPARWWLAVLVASGAYFFLSRRWPVCIRIWWTAMLVGGLALTIGLFSYRASWGQPRPAASSGFIDVTSPHRVGIVSALPLFWPEGTTPREILAGNAEGGPSMIVTRYHAHAIDRIDRDALSTIRVLIMAQPRLLQPEEMVAIDAWIRRGGRAVIFSDPLLLWPSRLPPGDPRRAPMTSLLDPLLAHWGLQLAPASTQRNDIERRMMRDGHVLMLAGASRFKMISSSKASDDAATCSLVEHDLMALCHIGMGTARLVADADLLDDRLWLADPGQPACSEAWASDIISLLDIWLIDPLSRAYPTSPLRVRDVAALIIATRWSVIAAFIWAGLGLVGQGRLSLTKLPASEVAKVSSAQSDGGAEAIKPSDTG